MFTSMRHVLLTLKFESRDQPIGEKCLPLVARNLEKAIADHVMNQVCRQKNYRFRDKINCVKYYGMGAYDQMIVQCVDSCWLLLGHDISIMLCAEHKGIPKCYVDSIDPSHVQLIGDHISCINAHMPCGPLVQAFLSLIIVIPSSPFIMNDRY